MSKRTIARASIAKAAKVTDTVVENWNIALRSLQTNFVNGAGVLDDRSMTYSNLYHARVAIDKAMAALSGFNEWPTNEDYDIG